MPQMEATRSRFLGQAPLVGTKTQDVARVTRAVTLCRCLRCDFEWVPRVAQPVRCPSCASKQWHLPRFNRKAGRPTPTAKGKPRGRALASGFDARRRKTPKTSQGENDNG